MITLREKAGAEDKRIKAAVIASPENLLSKQSQKRLEKNPVMEAL
jgi:hypothetical protein